jgi:hypothetical protein
MGVETEAWLVVRRDHDGNLDVLRMPDGTRFAWELTETQADAVIAALQSLQRKPHGQSYWRLSYRQGELHAFLKNNNIRF